MLVIKPQLMEQLESRALLDFKAHLLDHLKQFSPPLFKAAGEGRMKELITLGMSRAAQYGFTWRGPLRFYHEMMLLFGSEFDTDPQYPWAYQILSDPDTPHQMGRADALFDKVCDYRAKVAGENDVHTFDAYRKLRALASTPLDLEAGSLSKALVSEVRRIYPQKAQYLGEAALEALVKAALQKAIAHDFTTQRAAMLMLVLMLAFGHACDSDPQFSWIGKTLQDDLTIPPQQKAERLEKRAVTWLDYVLINFQEETKQ